MSIKYFALVLLVILAMANDRAAYKISNMVNIAFITFGVGLYTYNDGKKGFIISILAAAAPVLLLFPLFALRMLGAGDIKLFASIGAIMGLNFVLETVMYSFLWGGFIALVLMIVRKNSGKRFTYLINYFKSCILSCSLLPYTNFQNKPDESKFRFSYAIAFGVLFQNILLISGEFLLFT